MRLKESDPERVPLLVPRCRADRDDPRGLRAPGRGEETEDAHRVAGRIAARRGSGKAAFLDLVDRTGKIQLHARVDVLGEEPFARLSSLDLGDLIGVDGARAAQPPRRAVAARRSLSDPRQGAASAARQASRSQRRRDPLPPSRARPDRKRGRPQAVHRPRADHLGDPRLSRRGRVSSRSRRRCCSRSTAARWRGRSRRTTTRSTATCTCGSPPSCTSSACSSAAWSGCTSWARTSATRASRTSTTPSSRWSSATRPTPTTTTRRPAWKQLVRAAAAAVEYAGELDFSPAMAPRRLRRGDRGGDRDRRAGPSRGEALRGCDRRARPGYADRRTSPGRSWPTICCRSTSSRP